MVDVPKFPFLKHACVAGIIVTNLPPSWASIHAFEAAPGIGWLNSEWVPCQRGKGHNVY